MVRRRQSCKDLGEKHSYHMDKYPFDRQDYRGSCRDKERRFDVGDILKAGGWRETESEGRVWHKSYRGFWLWLGVRTLW